MRGLAGFEPPPHPQRLLPRGHLHRRVEAVPVKLLDRRRIQHLAHRHAPVSLAAGRDHSPSGVGINPARPWGIRCDRQRLPGYTARHEPPYPRASALMSSNRRFPAPVREAMTASGAAATCIAVELDGGAPEAAFFINLAGPRRARRTAGSSGNGAVPCRSGSTAMSSRPPTGAVVVLRPEVHTGPFDPFVCEILVTPGEGGRALRGAGPALPAAAPHLVLRRSGLRARPHPAAPPRPRAARGVRGAPEDGPCATTR